MPAVAGNPNGGADWTCAAGTVDGIVVVNVMFAVVAVLAVIFLAMTGLVAIQPQKGGSTVPWGPETPDGERWELAGLAQLPGTRLTALPLAKREVRELPPEGAVVVATANTPEQYRQYQRLGFTGGPKRRVHRVVGAGR